MGAMFGNSNPNGGVRSSVHKGGKVHVTIDFLFENSEV